MRSTARLPVIYSATVCKPTIAATTSVSRRPRSLPSRSSGDMPIRSRASAAMQEHKARVLRLCYGVMLIGVQMSQHILPDGGPVLASKSRLGSGLSSLVKQLLSGYDFWLLGGGEFAACAAHFGNEVTEGRDVETPGHGKNDIMAPKRTMQAL